MSGRQMRVTLRLDRRTIATNAAVSSIVVEAHVDVGAVRQDLSDPPAESATVPAAVLAGPADRPTVELLDQAGFPPKKPPLT